MIDVLLLDSTNLALDNGQATILIIVLDLDGSRLGFECNNTRVLRAILGLVDRQTSIEILSLGLCSIVASVLLLVLGNNTGMLVICIPLILSNRSTERSLLIGQLDDCTRDSLAGKHATKVDIGRIHLGCKHRQLGRLLADLA